jgi:hypothetical protein
MPRGYGSWQRRAWPILGDMNDEFQFGERAKHPARLSGPRPSHPKSSIPFKLVGIVAGLLVAAVAAFVFLNGADEAGKQIAEAQSETLTQVDRAYDAAAQGTVGRAVVVAQTLYAEHGSFITDLPTLSAFDPGLRFTSGSSTGPETVSYTVSGMEFAAAVRSGSGACWWVKVDASSATTYGSGPRCTGTAALAASAPFW